MSNDDDTRIIEEPTEEQQEDTGEQPANSTPPIVQRIITTTEHAKLYFIAHKTLAILSAVLAVCLIATGAVACTYIIESGKQSETIKKYESERDIIEWQKKELVDRALTLNENEQNAKEQQQKIDEEQVKLNNKEYDLKKKEQELTQKEQDLNNRNSQLDERERNIAYREQQKQERIQREQQALLAAQQAPSYSDSTGGYAFYKNCSAARAAGAAPIYRGQPGYRDKLDRDGDGIACEWS